MKKKNLLGVAALAGLLAVSATSCTGGSGNNGGYENPDLTGKTLNVYINYCAQTGVTFTGLMSGFETYTNPIDGITYTKGTLLPMWKAVQENLGCQIKDAVWDFTEDGYTKKKTADQWTVLKESANFANIDLLMTDAASAAEMNQNSKLANLNNYLEYMPNFSKFLDEHPSVKSEMTNADGQLYMLPYFDGLDTIEKMILMNTEIVQKLLDNDSAAYDEVAAPETAYSATIDTSADYKIKISVNGKPEDFTVKAAKNPITAQNELATKNGKTYVEALKAYIDAAYMPSGKYQKRSEVFTSESACYHTDDLIALMRCAVNNSTYLGHAGQVQGIVPREGKDSRIDSILYFAQIWGVQGLSSEKDYLYYGADGKLKDARTTQKTYDAVTHLHELYQEGLIINGFENKASSYQNDYLAGAKGATLLMYDYNATQSVYNKVDSNGVGTATSLYSGIMPVLPPVAEWENDTLSGDAYKYTRYTDDVRANKGSGTVIPVSETKDENQIIAACQLADYFYSEEGANLQDFGPTGVNETTGKSYIDGVLNVGAATYQKYSSTIISEINKSGLGWNNYFRTCVGTTQGHGHVRSDGVDYQVTNEAGQKGLSNILSAISSGAVICATTSRPAGFGASVPSQWSESPKTTDTYADLTTFWTRAVGKSYWRAVVVDGWDENTLNSLKGLWSVANQDYLQHYQTLLDSKNI